jgi:hypothetical protein
MANKNHRQLGRACHPELVEGSRVEAGTPCFDKLSMTAFVLKIA